MNRIPFAIDLHCHPQFKPYSLSFTDLGYKNQSKTITKRSLWYQSEVSAFKASLNTWGNLTLFSQANLQAAYSGNLQVLVVSLGSVEQGFVKSPKLGLELSALVNQLVTGFGKKRIEKLQNMKDYWADFQQEVDFMATCENLSIKIGSRWLTYKWVKNFAELKAVIAQNETIPEQNTSTTPFTIALIPSAEGLHILNCGLERPLDENEILANLKKLKTQKVAPWFVGICHHFYNGLCGHARSFKGSLINFINQKEGLNTGFTEIGKKVVEVLLDSSIGRRMYIDIKHMSVESRKYYIDLVKNKYGNKIPLIISHGVANGVAKYGDTKCTPNAPGNTFFNVTKGNDHDINTNEINFYDEEILDLVRSKGIMGLQLDERRIANELTVKNLVKERKNSNAQRKQRSHLIWNQIQYIAQLCDARGLDAWHHLGIGSDYDGIVDPLNSFWTMADFRSLEEQLTLHAEKFIGTGKHPMRWPQNQLTAEDIIHRIFYKNIWDFFERWY